MAKVLCLSSQVVWGPVGNTAAVPALQAAGHEVLQVPTVLLSHHPGHGRPVVQAMAAEMMAALIESVEAKGGLAGCTAVMTGYFATAAQVGVAASIIRRLRAANSGVMVLTDPVMGDDGRLYVPDDVASAIRTDLVPLAGILTPNCFELSWLTGASVMDHASALAAARRLPVAEVVVTSVPVDDQQLGTLLFSQSLTHFIRSVKRQRVPNGTGDYLAGAYLAARLRQAPAVALEQAMNSLETVIAKSGSGVLQNT
jgi:pyridoxine kinase